MFNLDNITGLSQPRPQGSMARKMVQCYSTKYFAISIKRLHLFNNVIINIYKHLYFTRHGRVLALLSAVRSAPRLSRSDATNAPQHKDRKLWCLNSEFEHIFWPSHSRLQRCDTL